MSIKGALQFSCSFHRLTGDVSGALLCRSPSPLLVRLSCTSGSTLRLTILLTDAPLLYSIWASARLVTQRRCSSGRIRQFPYRTF